MSPRKRSSNTMVDKAFRVILRNFKKIIPFEGRPDTALAAAMALEKAGLLKGKPEESVESLIKQLGGRWELTYWWTKKIFQVQHRHEGSYDYGSFYARTAKAALRKALRAKKKGEL